MTAGVLQLGLSASEWWVIVTAVVCAVACALPGCFLVLRRMSMLGDAVSHAILPGLAAAFLFSHSRSLIPMLAGAMVAGVLAAVGAAGVRRLGRLPEDTSLGLVFSVMFALGVILISVAAPRVDLDPGCLLYGLLEFSAWDRVQVAGLELPRTFVWLSVVLLANVAVIALFYKELKITTFDPALAASIGIAPAIVSALLLTMTTATCVASFEAVGSILVIAMLVTPGVVAGLFSERLSRVLVLAALIAAATAVGGYLLAREFNVTAAGMIATLSGAVFVAGVMLAPRKGVLPRLARHGELVIRIAREDLLADLYREEERTGRAARVSVASPAGDSLRQSALRAIATRLARHGGELAPVEPVGSDGLGLTAAGRDRARGLIRAHRLWESYLSANTPLTPDHLHEPSHRAEHFIDPQTSRDLERQLEDAAVDPHGRTIPSERERPSVAPPPFDH